MSVVDWAEHAARAFESPTTRWETPGDLATHLDPRTVQTPALDLIDQALVDAANTPDARLVISMPPQEGKSTRVAGDFPVWLLARDPDLRIVTASYGQSLATRNGRAIRRRIENTPDLGLTIADDNGAAHDWTIADHIGGVYSIGIGGPGSGRPADVLILDDPIKDRKEADSITYRDAVWDWWTDVATARLAPGAPVIVILTRWHHDDIVGRLLERDKDAGWTVLNIPAEADHDPTKGETDPLGREPGEFMQSARKRTPHQWEQRKKTVGPRTWASLYQGRPSPVTSGIFPADWPRYTSPPWIEQPDGARRLLDNFDQVIMSWDLAFKDTTSSDYVVGQVWGLAGPKAYLLDMVRARLDFTATIAAVHDMRARWPQARAIFIEDKANGPAVITSLSASVPGVIPIEPDGGKYARAVAIQPFTAAGNVVLPDPSILPNVVHLTEEAADFPNGAHDDTVDALTQALNQMFLHPLLGVDGDIITAEDLLDLDIEDFGDY